MKIFFRRIHLYLGLAAGLVISVSCLTGAALVFEKELTELTHHDRYYVKPSGPRLSIDVLAAKVQATFPGTKITRVQLFADPGRSVQVQYEEAKKEKPKQAGKPAKEGKKGTGPKEQKEEKAKTRTAFMNPYTGEMIESYSYAESFYYQIFSLHRWLLAGKTGKLITGISTFIFLFILITGFILWWPKTRNILKQRLKVKWDGNWKRVTNDLHVVFGFYTSIFLFISAFTGLTWSFDWFNNALYASLGTSPKATPPPNSGPTAPGEINYEDALRIVQAQTQDGIYYSLSAPKDSAGAFQVNVLPPKALHENATTTYFIDQYEGHIIKTQTFAERTSGQKIRATIKPLHTGAIFGWPSKIFAFILALLGATFPTTGTIMWLNRTRKKKKKPALVQQAV
ncbi:putative iron-regulated membrane protein [Chitinophaga skermanii]|uniref:Putative iron-regulated membrane protein n=1 Tax=Chitinophaga skermanii TaxID=331697 RepID=A0A327Q0V1_9BACT|nr:PepSY-associated TM helix domain-containing protein [Chitinophaga skermanii]RAI97663.1 putative iron-regulated membrane protein [Chitinophaga skermanii]